MALETHHISRLYSEHAASLLRFFARRTLQAEVAVDLVGETFAQAIEDRAQFRGGDDREALAWIYAIARHELSEYFRRGNVERRALTRLGIQQRPLTEVDYERVEQIASLNGLRETLAQGLAELTEQHREALQLRIVQERSYPEIAAHLSVSEQTARARVSRALRALAQCTTLPERSPSYAERE